MTQIQEVWVNAVLMPTGEIITGGIALGVVSGAGTRTGWIDHQFVKFASDYQLVPRRKSVADGEKKA